MCKIYINLQYIDYFCLKIFIIIIVSLEINNEKRLVFSKKNKANISINL